MSSPRALDFQGVAQSFEGAEKVLRGLDATIPLEGVTFVVGRSGSGKSVLCRLAVGLLRPDQGQVRLLGVDVHAAPERALRELRARCPYLVQGPALLDWLTLEQNVALAAKKNGSPPGPRVAHALERVGLLRYAGAFPPSVGPGLKKRAAIARALVLEPEFLLLDEPTTGLDRSASAQVNEVIGSLRAEGLGALVV
ncbi:MAG: ATP-binding cassette domain-containing protein, partial [Myxococcaceae bacterium]